MTSIFIFMGFATTLAVFAIAAKACAKRPAKANEGEKGEIIKQLLAQAERENSISANSPPDPKNLGHASISATHDHSLEPLTQSPINPKRPILFRPNVTDPEIEEQIRLRAHELYQERGGVDGNATDDWLRARKEVLGHKAKATAASS